MNKKDATWVETVGGVMVVIAIFALILWFLVGTRMRADYYLNNQTGAPVNFILAIDPQGVGASYDQQWTVPAYGTVVLPGFPSVDAVETQQMSVNIYSIDFSSEKTGWSYHGEYDHTKRDFFLRYMDVSSPQLQGRNCVKGEQEADAEALYEGFRWGLGIVLLAFTFFGIRKMTTMNHNQP